ncbi:protein SINE3-like [Pistacia vera]|uniref:protein SINE3-like n=1 Tax=Pistacia vera TaxID=55513 RepID=UPI001262D6DC|nr:protein SINE3-like [Pistacia vera]
MSERFAFLYRLSDLGFIRISLEPSTIAKSGSMQPAKPIATVDLANRKSKDSHSKKKVVKKNLFTSVPENLLPDIVKEPADFSSISEISDADESFALASLEPFNLPLTSTIKINKNESDLSSDDYHLKILNGSKIISLQAEVLADLLKQARNQVSNTIDTDARSKRLLDVLVKIIVKELYAVPQKKDRLTELVLMKTRIVSLCFLIWIIAVSVILFFNSSSGGSFIGLPPT